MEEVTAAIRGLLATRGRNVAPGRLATCFACDALSCPGELSGEMVRVLVRALLVSGEDGGGGMPRRSYSAVRVCTRCNQSLGTLVDLYKQLEDLESKFCGLRERVGSQLILRKLKLSQENYAGWAETVKSVKDVFPSKATGRLRKTCSVAVGTDQVGNVEDTEGIADGRLDDGNIETGADSAVAEEPAAVRLLRRNATSTRKPKDLLAERSCKESSDSSDVGKEGQRSKVRVVGGLALSQEQLGEPVGGKKRPVESQDGSPQDSHPPGQKKSTVDRSSTVTKGSLVGRPRAGDAMRVRFVESREEVGNGDDSEDDDAMPRDVDQETLIRMPEFNDLPNEVIRKIVSYCTSSAVLQLRLVSQRIKGIVKDSNRFKDVFQDVWIHLYSGETLKKFLKKAPHFPFQNFRIGMGETATPHLFEDSERLQQFMDRCSASIRRLQVSRMYCGTVVGEMNFYKSLDNLQSLEIQEMRPREGFQEQRRELPKSGPVGRSMKTLKVLYERSSGDYLIEWIRLCPSLEVISVPCPLDTTVNIGAEVFGGVELLGIYPVYPYVLRLGSEGKLEHLKILDLNGVRMELGLCSEGDRRFFHDLLTRRNDFRLKNVSADMLEEVRNVCVFPEWPWGTFELFKRKVVSTCGIHEMLLLDDEGSPLLEEVAFKPFDCPLPLHLNLPLDVLRLSSLKKIKACVGWTFTASVQSFVDRLFLPETPRETVVDLELRCDPLEGLTMTPAYLDGGFPNLSRVLLNLDGFDREERIQVIEVMSRKTLLEDLSLVTDEGTPEEAFFGNQEDSPVLLRLASLRKLSLESNCWGERCEVMGDRSLRLFARMSLSHLIIKGGGWEMVTDEGIRALLDGPFGESVVSFELDGLKDGSEARWEVLTDLEELAQRNRIKWS